MPGSGFDSFGIGPALEDIVPAMVRVPYPGKGYLAPLRPIPIDLLLNQAVLIVDLLQSLALSDISDYFPVDPLCHPLGSMLWSEQVVHDSLVAVFLNDPLRIQGDIRILRSSDGKLPGGEGLSLVHIPLVGIIWRSEISLRLRIHRDRRQAGQILNHIFVMLATGGDHGIPALMEER